MNSIKKILVRCPNWIGDQILAYPFFFALRKLYPDAHIAAVCRPWVKSVQFSKQVDEVFILPSNSFLEIWKHGRSLRNLGPWDFAIALPNSISAAFHLFSAGARNRLGYASDGRSFLLTSRIRWDDRRELHRSQAYLNLLGDPGRKILRQMAAKSFFGAHPSNALDEKIPGVLASFDGQSEWKAVPLGSKISGNYVVFAPGATAESRRWPIQSFVSLAKLIFEKWSYQIVVVGGKSESSLAKILADLPGVIDWTDRGPVSDLFEVFRNAKFTVCNESGLAHVSALSGAFTQIVCGAADPRRTEPIGPGKVQVAFNPVECWPCEKNVCLQPPQNKIQCLMGISARMVFEEISRGIKA